MLKLVLTMILLNFTNIFINLGMLIAFPSSFWYSKALHYISPIKLVSQSHHNRKHRILFHPPADRNLPFPVNNKLLIELWRMTESYIIKIYRAECVCVCVFVCGVKPLRIYSSCSFMGSRGCIPVPSFSNSCAQKGKAPKKKTIAPWEPPTGTPMHSHTH